MTESTHLWQTHFTAMAALLNIVGLGMISAFTASATVNMKIPGSRFSSISSNQITWVASLPSIAAIFGNLLSGYLSLKIGRKAVLMCASVPLVVGWLMIAYAPTIPWLYSGRLLSGFSSGMYSVAVPAYVIEIATIKIRGFLCSCYQVSYTIGVLIAMLLGITIAWSWLAIVGAFLSTSAAFFMYFIPESPPWLIANEKYAEAVESFRALKGGDADILQESSNANELHFIEQPQNTVSFREFKKPELYKPIVLSIGLVFFQQFSGINALMAYTVEIFEHAESSVDPSIAAGVVAGVQVLATSLGSALVDKNGRTKLYAISGIFVSVGLITLGIYGILAKKLALQTETYGWIPLASFIVFVASFSLGYGPIPYLMTPEFVPLHCRSAVLAISGVFSSLFLFFVTKTFDDFRYFLSDYGVYWVYGFFSLLGCLFCWFCLPETKGKSLYDIQYSFQNHLNMNDIQ
ncbi:Facilitated trehalose transporter Tret1 [Araneus ventricosus]|uniref:Facilitated trehalose transporter Tret1 n=1 Tax=Araneus ventricosus TaxID=182803 RepID=A0A4Y2LPK2_ARAVE|nr:Facilitated trehalose transporter Tret1 [Araneus ventricosus]